MSADDANFIECCFTPVLNILEIRQKLQEISIQVSLCTQQKFI